MSSEVLQEEVRTLAERLKGKADLYGDLGFSQPVPLSRSHGPVQAISCLYCGAMVLCGGWQTSRPVTQQDAMSAHVHYHVAKGDYVLDEEEFRVYNAPKVDR